MYVDCYSKFTFYYLPNKQKKSANNEEKKIATKYRIYDDHDVASAQMR